MKNYKEENDLEYDIESYVPPEEYPDWDGDESIMYILDHCNDYDDSVQCEICDTTDYGGYYICDDCGHKDNI
ncbi:MULTISPECIES: hypothetical protein [unclassified Clostridium]|uniref:hypothetical protein n=1 Tax=unclassified Clostridium TaxID=2614128 RepID=UPI00207AA778|nr:MULTISPECIES: hypothetical protein [unclassified Clostridium]